MKKPTTFLIEIITSTGFLLLLLVVLFIAIWARPVVAADMKIATAAPAGSRWVQQLKSAADAIEQQTEGRVRLKVYSGGVMGNDRSVLRKIRVGQLHGTTLTGGELRNIAPAATLYSLPMVFRSIAEVDYVRQRMDDVLHEAIIAAGYASFGFVEAGFASLMSPFPVRSLDDLAGSKIWVPEGDQISYDFMQSLGLAPVTLPITDVMTGLQTGLIDVIAAPPAGAMAFQWHTHLKYLSDQPLVYVYGALLISGKALQHLDAEDQLIVRKHLSSAMAQLDRESRADNLAAREALLAAGMQSLKPGNDAASNWYAMATPALESALAGTGLVSYYQTMQGILAQASGQGVTANPVKNPPSADLSR